MGRQWLMGSNEVSSIEFQQSKSNPSVELLVKWQDLIIKSFHFPLNIWHIVDLHPSVCYVLIPCLKDDNRVEPLHKK